MVKRYTLIAAAIAGVLVAGWAGAESPLAQPGDRGVKTPATTPEVTKFKSSIPEGVPTIPSASDPMNPNESKPFVQSPEGVRPLVRGDNPNLPNPVTPSAANESQPQPKRDTTNSSGMGGTREDVNRSGTYDSYRR